MRLHVGAGGVEIPEIAIAGSNFGLVVRSGGWFDESHAPIATVTIIISASVNIKRPNPTQSMRSRLAKFLRCR